MKQKIKIREAEKKDTTEVRKILEYFFTYLNKIKKSKSYKIKKNANELFLSSTHFANKISSKIELVAYISNNKNENKFAGLCVIFIKQSPLFDPEEFAFIEVACVLPEFQKRGVMSALIERTKMECKKRGITRLECSVLIENLPASKFWEKKGFIEGKKNLSIKI